MLSGWTVDGRLARLAEKRSSNVGEYTRAVHSFHRRLPGRALFFASSGITNLSGCSASAWCHSSVPAMETPVPPGSNVIVRMLSVRTCMGTGRTRMSAEPDGDERWERWEPEPYRCGPHGGIERFFVVRKIPRRHSASVTTQKDTGATKTMSVSGRFGWAGPCGDGGARSSAKAAPV